MSSLNYKNYFKETTGEKIAMAVFFRVATWGPPLFPSYFVYSASLHHLHMHPGAAILSGVIVEALGIAAMSNLLAYAQRVKINNDELTNSRYRMTKWVVAFYITLTMLLVVFLEGLLGASVMDATAILEIIAKGLLVLASPIGAFTYLIRSEYIEAEESEWFQGQREKKRRESEQELQDQLNAERLTFEMEMHRKRAESELELERMKAESKLENERIKVQSKLLQKGVASSVAPNTPSIENQPSDTPVMRQSRLLAMLQNIDTPADINKSEIAAELGVSRHTIIRDMKSLQKSGKLSLNGHVKVTA